MNAEAKAINDIIDITSSGTVYERKTDAESHGVIGDGIIDTPEELMNLEVSLSIYNGTFWDFWVQKMFRNFASMKFQLLILIYIPIIWGMFNINPNSKEPWISAVIGLGFLGGGYITLATSRILAKTSLVEKSNTTKELDTEQ